MKTFEYSRQPQLTELEDRLYELKGKSSAAAITLEDIENGLYSEEEKIRNIEAAIKSHEFTKNEEQTIFSRNHKAEEQFKLKKAAYPLSLEYLKHLEAAFEIATSVQGGYGYNQRYDFEIVDGEAKVAFKVLIEKAKRGINHLQQFKK